MRPDRRRRRWLDKPLRWMTALRERTAGWPSIRTWTEWDWAGAEPEWRRALEIDPNVASAHAYFAHFLAITGRIDEAIPHSERALELDPFNALFHGLYAVVLCGARRYDDAMAAARTALAMQPSMPVASFALQWAFVLQGNARRAPGLSAGLVRRRPRARCGVRAGPGGSRLRGRAAAHRRSPGGTVREVRQGPTVSNVAQHYLYAGDYDRAMDWLEKAFEVRDPNLPYIALCPIFDPLRSDPRFQDLLRRMNLPTNGYN